MYGADVTQASQIAVSGFAVFGLGWSFLSIGVLFMATLTLVSIIGVIVHRQRRGSVATRTPEKPTPTNSALW